MRDLLIGIIEREYGRIRKGKRRLELAWLEKAVMNSFEYRSDYVDAGGLAAFSAGIEALLAEGYLAVLSKARPYKTSSLSAVYWLPATDSSSISGWNETSMLRVLDARELNLDFYKIHPEEQTPEVWGYIERLYDFFRTAEEREYVTREERSLELFGSEKWLSEPEGMQFLSRLRLTLNSLKAIHISEPFIYYRKPEQPVRNILISENHSFFYSARRLLHGGHSICGLQPEMLIYGEGWKIVKSLLYLEELNIDPNDTVFHYAGDMDKAGWDIYGKLKLVYSGLNLNLAIPVYQEMMRGSRNAYSYPKEQKACDPSHWEVVLQEISADPELKSYIEGLLAMNRRIPQEVLNYEVMARLAQA